MKKLSWTLVALVAAGVFVSLWTLPPRPVSVDSAGWADLAARTIPGAYHIHTTRSDGIGDRNAVAAAAARAGLRFVVITDHGDGTRPPDPPAYVDGVLVLDGVEVSTDEGHYAALDMRRAPYPLGGTAESVVEDVARLGGFGVAAHPDSPRPALRWTDDQPPIDGIEWVNTDSEWRGESRTRLARAGLAYFLRPGPALVSLFDRPVTLERWDRLTKTRPIVALGGADAHGGVGRRSEDAGRSLAGTIGIPGYDASFRAFSNRIVLDKPLTGDAAADAQALYGALRKGSVFTAIDALAGPALLDFAVESGFDRVPMGGTLPSDSDVTIVARALVPPGAEMRLVHNGRVAATAASELRRVLTGATGTYRIEVVVPRAPGTPRVPWLVSNPIYFLDAGPKGTNPPEPARSADPIAPFPWRIEKDPTSSGRIRTTDHDAALEYKLGDGPRNSQFVALASDIQKQPLTAIELSLAGDRPLRVSVQVRRADGGRWGRSFYVDPSGSNLKIPLSTLRPIGGTATGSLSPTDIASILVVLDLVNTAPGHAGILRVSASALIN